VAVAAAHPVRLMTAEPADFEQGSPEFGETRPERRLGNPRIITCASSAYALPLLHPVGAWRALVASYTPHAMRCAVAEPAGFEEGCAEFGETSLKRRLGRFRVIARTGAADTLPLPHGVGVRRAIVTIDAPRSVRPESSKPFLFEQGRTQFVEPSPERCLGSCRGRVLVLYGCHAGTPSQSPKWPRPVHHHHRGRAKSESINIAAPTDNSGRATRHSVSIQLRISPSCL
jgi:hypothetical protein